MNTRRPSDRILLHFAGILHGLVAEEEDRNYQMTNAMRRMPAHPSPAHAERNPFELGRGEAIPRAWKAIAQPVVRRAKADRPAPSFTVRKLCSARLSFRQRGISALSIMNRNVAFNVLLKDASKSVGIEGAVDSIRINDEPRSPCRFGNRQLWF
jgi:hypothetical protein